MEIWIKQNDKDCIDKNILYNFIDENKPISGLTRKPKDKQWYFHVDTEKLDLFDKKIKNILVASVNESFVNRIYRKHLTLEDFFTDLHNFLKPHIDTCHGYDIECDVYHIHEYHGTTFIDITDDPNGKCRFTVTIPTATLKKNGDVKVNTRIKVYGKLLEYKEKGILQIRASSIYPALDKKTGKPKLTRADAQRAQWHTCYYALPAKDYVDFDVHCIGIIASSTKSAGYNDFVGIMQNKAPDKKTVIKTDTLSAKNIIQMINEFNTEGKCDCICIVRGGTTNPHFDFLDFDNPELLHAIQGSSIPVLTGIGHYNDNPVCCKMSYCNGSTPTDLAYKVCKALTPHEAKAKIENSSELLNYAVNKAKSILFKLFGWN